jgi:hypothetical protein
VTILKRLTRQLADLVLIFIIFVVLAVAVLYPFHRWYVADLATLNPQADKALPHVDGSTLLKVGSIIDRKRSSFTNFAEAKPPGVVRIGAFGDSHTYGDEVGETADFPSQLAKLLHDRGIANVEVLNFGSSWYGFGQAFILWEDLAKKFGIDIVILGPTTFHPDRDTRFNHTNGTWPYFIHSRFVVENGTVRRIDPVGSTIAEKFASYYGFWPDWRYLRYDRNTPTFIQAILPKGKTLDNPFYYDARPEKEETADIYRLLVEKIMDSGVPLIIGEYGEYAWLNEALRAKANDRTCVAELQRTITFPHVTPENHDSALGNLLLAEQFLSLLTGNAVEPEALRSLSPAPIPADEIYAERIGLQLFASVSVRQGNREIGQFVSSDLVLQKPTFIADNRFESLLALSDPQGTALDAVYLGLKSGTRSEFFIDHEDADGSASVSLGAPTALSGTINVDTVPVTGLGAGYREPVIYFSRSAAVKHLGKAVAGGTISFRLGDMLLLKGPYDARSDSFKLMAGDASAFLLRANLPSPLTPSELSGDIDLIVKKDRREIGTPLGQLATERKPFSPYAQCKDGWKPPLRTISLSGN